MTKNVSNIQNLTTQLSNPLQDCFSSPLNNTLLISYLWPNDKNIPKGIKNKHILHENVYIYIYIYREINILLTSTRNVFNKIYKKHKIFI